MKDNLRWEKKIMKKIIICLVSIKIYRGGLTLWQ